MCIRDRPSIADDPSIQSAFYGAPTVITLFGPKQFLYAINDCSVAAENMMPVSYTHLDVYKRQIIHAPHEPHMNKLETLDGKRRSTQNLSLIHI